MYGRSHLMIVVVLLGAAAVLGLGALALFGSGGRVAGDGYWTMGYVCDPVSEGTGGTSFANAGWRSIDGAWMMGDSDDEEEGLLLTGSTQMVDESIKAWPACVGPDDGWGEERS